MESIRSTTREAAEDIFFGQVVMNWARWGLVASGMVVALWSAKSTGALVAGVTPVVALMLANFYLHGRALAGRPANETLILIASIADLAVVTGMVALGMGTGEQGLRSPLFVAYYPLVAAFSFVMPPKASAAYTAGAMGAFALASILTMTVQDTGDLKALVARAIALGAMGGLSAFYWRMQRKSRRSANNGSGA